MEDPSQLRIISKLSKRVMSDVEGAYASSIPVRLSELREKQTTILKIPIKINRSKLPPDFFARAQGKNSSIHKNKLSSRQGSDKISKSLPQKPLSQRLAFSPEKTSFFGFFNQEQEQIKAVRNINSLKPFKRNFQTSQSPKREANPQTTMRKLTPMALSRNSDFIDLFGNKPVGISSDYPQIQSPYLKRIKMSPRKQHQSKYLDYQQSYPGQQYIPNKPVQRGQAVQIPRKNNRNKEVNRENEVQTSRQVDNIQKQNSQQEGNLIFWQATNNNSMNLTFSSNNKSSTLPPINNKLKT